MAITIRKHRRNLSYDDATTLDEILGCPKKIFEIFRVSGLVNSRSKRL